LKIVREKSTEITSPANDQVSCVTAVAGSGSRRILFLRE